MRNRRVAACLLAPLCWAAALTASALPEPTLEWKVDLKTSVECSPTPYPSQKPDSVIIGIGGRIVRIGGDGKVVFDSAFGPEATRGGIFDVGLADLDGDGTDEIVAGHKDGFVAALNAADGKVLWLYELGASMAVWQLAMPADLDGDGRPEILAVDTGGWLTCLDAAGQLRWRAGISQEGDINEIATPAVGDINNDGRPEIVLGTQTGHVLALNGDGRLLWSTHVPPLQAGRTMPLIADLDNDGQAEIYTMSSMLALNGGVVSLNGQNGSVRWTGATETNVYHGRGIVRFSDGSLGLTVADKGNSVAAFSADGTRRWRIDVSGRGIWQPPVCGDIDGDGTFEVIVAVRDSAIDGSGNTWYALNADTGEQVGAYTVGGGFGGACIADIDGDGVLEVVLSSRGGAVHSFSFGGPAKPEALVFGTLLAQPYPLKKEGAQPPALDEGPAATFASDLSGAHYGRNALVAKLPSAGPKRVVEVATELPDGTREVRLYRPAKDAASVDAMWPVTVPGAYNVTVRLINTANGAVEGVQKLQTTIDNVALTLDSPAFRAPLNETIEILRGLSQQAPEVSIALSRRWTEAETRLDLAGVRVANAAGLTPVERDRLADDVADLREYFAQTKAYATLLASEVAAGRTPSFVMWQDENPWDNVNPLNTIPAQGGEPTINMWAFGNETESVCVNVMNVQARPLALRIGAGTVTKEGEDKPIKQAHEVTELLRPTWLPSKYGLVVPDMLPAFGPGYILNVAPGEVQQIWINVNTKSLEPGVYRLTWPINTLEQPPVCQDLTVRLEVSTVRLPEKSRYLFCTWSRNRIDGISTVPDLNKHLQTVWYNLPLPPAKADAEGNLTGVIDWTEHDAILREIKQPELLLYTPPPTPAFPEGVTPSEEVVRKARRNYIKAMLDHLNSFGLGYKNFMWYVEDEPGLNGSIESYMRHAKELKAIDPEAQNYANPWGAVNLAKTEELATVTDVWQPGMDTIEQLGQPYIDTMKKGGKIVMTYTPPGNARILRPLGFYRGQAWLCLYWGIDGGGWWTYYQGDDLFTTQAEREPSYGAISWDGRAVVTSRRWEANRDGAEDFNAVWMLRDAAKAKKDTQAEQVIKAAVDYVAKSYLTGAPREAAPYDFDYATFMTHRQKIREALERLGK